MLARVLSKDKSGAGFPDLVFLTLTKQVGWLPGAPACSVPQNQQLANSSWQLAKRENLSAEGGRSDSGGRFIRSPSLRAIAENRLGNESAQQLHLVLYLA